MFKMLWHILFALCWNVSEALLCYNCSTSNHESSHCGGDFSPSGVPFNSSRHFLVNCTEENAMCFVRSWSARAQHLWLVQRGCYLPASADPLPRAMSLPTRAMTCKHERFADAEYKVCLCQADWCNSSSKINPFVHFWSSTKTTFIFILIYILFK